MAREYSEVTRKARELDLGDGFANDFAFRRYHLETESIGHGSLLVSSGI
jgi:hypothetical protein